MFSKKKREKGKKGNLFFFFLMQDQAQASQTVSLPGMHVGVSGRETKRREAAVADFA